MYKLSTTQSGHTGDVKAVKITPAGVMSASRDGTCSIDGSPIFELGNYLNSCASSETQVFCGAQDGTIACMDITTQEKTYFMGHTANVCALDAAYGMLASGSWDTTARIWKGSDPACEPLVLKGHSQSVWGVLILSEDEVLTAGADKRIIRWKDGQPLQEYLGHTDAVRGLCRIDNQTFASCSNDNTVRLWTLEGAELAVLRGHSSFVYSVAHANGILFSSGEDRTVRVWKHNQQVQVITLPCVSLWSVDAVGQRLVVGSSDFKVRVFSSDNNDWNEAEISALEAAVASSTIGEDQVQLDDSQIKPESHLRTAGKEGDVAMVRQNGTVVAHQFSGGQWTKIGEVVGRSSDVKVQHAGKEYDFVFDVDIMDGEPPLKLPYNRSDNPHAVAERFIMENNLPGSYVEQVVQFLITNSGGTPTIESQGAVDPPSGTSATGTVPAVLQYDKPLQMLAYQLAPLAKAYNANAVKYGDPANVEALLTALPSSSGQLLTASLAAIERWELVDKLSAFDTLRLCIPNAETVPFVALISVLLSCLDPDVPKHAMLATRGLANLLSRHDADRMANQQPFAQALDMLKAFPAYTKPMQIAVATLLLNLVVRGSSADVSAAIVAAAPKIDDLEASYRLALAAGVRVARIANDKATISRIRPWLASLTEPRSVELAAAINSII